MMNNNQQLAVTQQMSVSDMSLMAETFAKSGLFKDTSDMAKAFVKIQAGQEIGIAPFQAMSGIHIIQGKPTIGAGIMASRVKGSGKYDYRVIQQDEKACSIDFYQGKEKIGNSTFTIEDAQKAGTQNLGKFPKNMLFARAISNGVKWYCPDVFTGPVYVPEEMEGLQQTFDVPHEEVFQLTESHISHADELIKNSTLDDDGKEKAATAIANAKSQTQYNNLVNRLNELQNVPA